MGGCISPIHLNYQSWEEDAKECVKDFQGQPKIRGVCITLELSWCGPRSGRRRGLNFHMVFIA
jgi:hypothetical protein